MFTTQSKPHPPATQGDWLTQYREWQRTSPLASLAYCRECRMQECEECGSFQPAHYKVPRHVGGKRYDVKKTECHDDTGCRRRQRAWGGR